MWKLKHILTCGFRYPNCLACKLIWHETEGWWYYYVWIAALSLEYGIIRGK